MIVMSIHVPVIGVIVSRLRVVVLVVGRPPLRALGCHGWNSNQLDERPEKGVRAGRRYTVFAVAVAVAHSPWHHYGLLRDGRLNANLRYQPDGDYASKATRNRTTT